MFPPPHTIFRSCCRHRCGSLHQLHSHRARSLTSNSQTGLSWPAGSSGTVLQSQQSWLTSLTSLPLHRLSPGSSRPACVLGWRGRTLLHPSGNTKRSYSSVSSFSVLQCPSVCLCEEELLQHLPGHTASHKHLFCWRWPQVWTVQGSLTGGATRRTLSRFLSESTSSALSWCFSVSVSPPECRWFSSPSRVSWTCSGSPSCWRLSSCRICKLSGYFWFLSGDLAVAWILRGGAMEVQEWDWVGNFQECLRRPDVDRNLLVILNLGLHYPYFVVYQPAAWW